MANSIACPTGEIKASATAAEPEEIYTKNENSDQQSDTPLKEPIEI